MLTPYYKYTVKVHYQEGGIPPFTCTLYAENEGHAQRIACYEAINRGWPREPISYDVEKHQ